MTNFDSIEAKTKMAKSCTELLSECKKRRTTKEIKPEGVKLKFLGVEPNDVYNPTIPFLMNGKFVIAGRVEARGDNAKSKVLFFEQQGENTWVKINDAPVFELEDPFVTVVGEDTVLGGVEVFPSRSGNQSDPVHYGMAFYKGKNLDNLRKFSVGPEKMKDIRIIELQNGHIGVFTRPQDGVYKQGKIGYIELESLSELTPENISKAKIIENQFMQSKDGHDEWGGVGQLQLLEGGKIGVIGHIAYLDVKKDKHYYAMSFVFNPSAHTASPIKIIATRDDFGEGKSKSPELTDICIPSGIYEEDGKHYLYAGLGDIEAGKLEIDYPF